MASSIGVEEFVGDRLLDAANLTKIAGDKVYPQCLPDASALPGVVYSRQSTQRAGSLGGPVGNANPRFRIECLAIASKQGYKQAVAMAKAVRDQLDGFRGEWKGHWIEECTIEDEFDDPDPPVFADGNFGIICRRVLIVSIDHAENTKNNLQPA